jgi:RNA polymerase sigma-70 factor (ECF subfamily)
MNVVLKHPDIELIERAMARDPASCRILVDKLTPPIQERVNAALIRRRKGSRQNVLDLTQDIFRVLLADDGKILRNWNPERGATLTGFVALIAERRVASALRSGRQSGHAEEPTELEDLDTADEAANPEEQALSRDLLERVLDELRIGTSAQGYEMFRLLFIEEREVEAVMQEAQLSRDAVYAWRSRLQKLVKKIAAELLSDPAGAPRRMKGGRT